MIPMNYDGNYSFSQWNNGLETALLTFDTLRQVCDLQLLEERCALWLQEFPSVSADVATTH